MPSKIEITHPGIVDQCRKLYYEDRLPVPEVAKRLLINRSTLYSFFARAGLQCRKKGMAGANNPSWKAHIVTREICEKLLKQGWTVGRIATHLNVSHSTAADHIRRYGLIPNKRKARERVIDPYGYAHILQKGHPRAGWGGYVREHILVWERVHGEPLPEGYSIHHLNGIKHDNRPENLVALPARAHHPYLVSQAQQQRIKVLEDEVAGLKVKYGLEGLA